LLLCASWYWFQLLQWKWDTLVVRVIDGEKWWLMDVVLVEGMLTNSS
jgi:hypothetical protein